MGFDGAVPATGASGRADHVAISVSGGADRPVHAHHSEDFVGQVVARLGYGPEVVAAAAARASINRTSVISEILAHGRISEAEFYRAVADSLGIDYRDKVDPDRIVLSERDGLALLRQPAIRLVRCALRDEPATIVVAPDERGLAALAARLRASPHLAPRIAIATPTTLRRMVMARCSERLTQVARFSLLDRLPQASAMRVVSGWQGFALGLAVACVGAFAVIDPWLGLEIAHVLFSLFFLACVVLRLLASGRQQVEPDVPNVLTTNPAILPRYTVLVALYKEAEIVPELLVELGNLAWPRGKVEIKLVCEADDEETLQVLRGQVLRPFVEIVEVPHSEPRTKPKALSYALQVSSGDLVVIYDAEDRPHKLQLMEAWERFRKGPPELACLQAPLGIVNGASTWLARMFAFEYSGLFRGMLPFLADRDLILPLGGTSNHFRRSALDAVGAWDPYNVTEDADLGMRLKRFGYGVMRKFRWH